MRIGDNSNKYFLFRVVKRKREILLRFIKEGMRRKMALLSFFKLMKNLMKFGAQVLQLSALCVRARRTPSLPFPFRQSVVVRVRYVEIIKRVARGVSGVGTGFLGKQS